MCHVTKVFVTPVVSCAFGSGTYLYLVGFELLGI